MWESGIHTGFAQINPDTAQQRRRREEEAAAAAAAAGAGEQEHINGVHFPIGHTKQHITRFNTKLCVFLLIGTR